MSIKDLFNKQQSKALTTKSIKEIENEVEGENYASAVVKNKNKFVPNVDFSLPENFSFFGSAEKYYTDSISRIYNEYPYDGSAREKEEFYFSSSYLDRYIFENEYPRTTGYVNFLSSSFLSRSSDGWNATVSSSMSYITVKGGPNEGPSGGRKGANVYNSSAKRESNLHFDAANGTTVEFWLKKGLIGDNHREAIFDLWNGETPSHVAGSGYGRFLVFLDGSATSTSPFRITYVSGTNDNCTSASLGSTSVAANTILDDTWRHFAVSAKNIGSDLRLRLYHNGELDQTTTITGGAITEVTGALIANLAALRTQAIPSDSSDLGHGCLSGSIDDFRYWKYERTSKEIGRSWRTNVHGGTNVDDANTKLGVYYKFNEGITGTSSVDSSVLDYSGRLSHGTWQGYSTNSRSTGSAIVDSNTERQEFRDPIIYSNHPDVVTLLNSKTSIGNYHDVTNNSAIYHTLPQWITEEDSEKDAFQLKNLTQILASFFDETYLKIQELSKLKNINYFSGSNVKPFPFANRLLESAGFIAPEIFVDASIISQLSARDEKKIFKKKLYDIKNLIYQNVYNNLSYILKSKGTEKSFRNLIRCFGVDEELIKINLYGNNTTYTFEENNQSKVVRKKYIDFNNADRFQGTVYQKESSIVSNSVSYISSSNALEYNIPMTVECEVLFPKKFDTDSDYYFVTPFISASLFGAHTAKATGADLTWADSDYSNFQVFAVRDQLESKDATFVLTSSTGGVIPNLTSSLFRDVYDNSKWNFAVRLKPSKYPHVDRVSGSTSPGSYDIEFYGVQTHLSTIVNEFSVSASLDSGSAESFLGNHRRFYCGAHRNNFTGSSLVRTDARISSLRYWFDYLDNDTIRQHAYDVKNFGRENPYRNSFLNVLDLEKINVPQIETLALNWDFATVTGSGPSSGATVSDAKFFVEDVSSGSLEISNARYSWLGKTLKKQHTGQGDFFLGSDTDVVDNDYVLTARKQLPETLNSSDMINILERDDEIFTRDSRPINYHFSIEKNMYQTISEEMINFFSTIKDFNNVIGEPVNRYRQDYKELGKLRNLFFERVGNVPDFEKYVEFYKWIDSSLSKMLQQLVPASANISDEIRTVIESHIFERNKYWTKFPTLEMTLGDPEAGAISINRHLYNWASGFAPVDLDEGKNEVWWKERAERDRTPFSTDNNVAETRNYILSSSLQVLNRSFTTPLRLLVNTENTASKGLRMVNVENIKDPLTYDSLPWIGTNVGTSSYTASVPNYSKDYEIVLTSGRRANNRALVISASSLDFSTSRASNLIAGLDDTAKVQRGSRKHIIVERFSAPGSPETGGDSNGGAGLDRESGEYSVYNSLNYRNFWPRDALTELYARHCGKFGIDETVDNIRGNDYNTSASFHKINKNPIQRYIVPASGSLITASVFDNWFIQHPIPQKDIGYRWISASYISAPLGHATSSDEIHFCSASDVVSYEDHVSPTRTLWTVANDARFYEYLYTDFVGLNYHFYEPLTSSLNTLGYPNNTPSLLLNTTFVNGGWIPPSGPLHNENVPYFNGLMLNRNGPYQYPSWKQIRNFEHVLVRDQRKNNIISFLNPSPDIRKTTNGGQRIAVKELRGNNLTNYIEPPLTERYFPLIHEVVSVDERNKLIDVPLKYTHGNIFSTFANTELVNKIGFEDFEGQMYDKIIDLYLNEDGEKEDNPLKDFNSLLYKEKVYPREVNTFLKNSRGREKYYFNWNNSRATRGGISNLTVLDTDVSNTSRRTRNIFGYLVQKSEWPLDARFNTDLNLFPRHYWSDGTVDDSRLVPENAGCGDLQNTYSIFFSSKHNFEYPGDEGPLSTASMWHNDRGLIGNSISWCPCFNKDLPEVELAKYNSLIPISPFENDGGNLYSKAFWEYTIGNSGSNKFCFSAWINFTMSLGTHPDFMTIAEFGDRRMAIGLCTGSNKQEKVLQYVRKCNTGTVEANASIRLSGSTWYHVMVSHNSEDNPKDNIGIYINGEPHTASIGGPAGGGPLGLYGRPAADSNGGDWALLGSSSNNDFPYEGMMSNIAVFNTSMSYRHAQEIYNKGRPKSLYLYPQFKHCISWWPLGNGYRYSDMGVDCVMNPYKHPLVFLSDSIGDVIQGQTFSDVCGNVHSEIADEATYGRKKILLKTQGENIGLYGVASLRDNLYLDSYIPNVIYNRPTLEYLDSTKAWSGISVTGSGNSSATASSDYTLLERYVRTTGSRCVVGDVKWTAPDESNRKPFYDSYKKATEDVRIKGKDYTIVPEFRISEHMDFFVRDKEGNFLEERNNFLSLTGSELKDSDSSLFYKTYSHSDFMKYFEIINNDHEGIANPSEITLKCSAFLKFVPYDGFYPAQRTLQLASLFSSSYSPYIKSVFVKPTGTIYDTSLYTFKSSSIDKASLRTFCAPFFGPGILYNSIKSGISVDFPIYDNLNKPPRIVEDFPGGTGGKDFIADGTEEAYTVQGSEYTGSTGLYSIPISGNYSRRYTNYMNCSDKYDLRGNDHSSQFDLNPVKKDDSVEWRTVLASPFDKRIPFEGLVEPENYLRGMIWDMEPEDSASFKNYLDDPKSNLGVKWAGEGDERYKMAMHNFLAEVPNFFLEEGKITTFISKQIPSEGIIIRDEEKNNYFGMDITISNCACKNLTDWKLRKNSREFKDYISNEHFLTKQELEEIKGVHTKMYDRDSAFGPAWVFTGSYMNRNNKKIDYFTDEKYISSLHYGYEPFTPSHQNGFGLARLIFFPFKGAGTYTLDEIQSHISMSFVRFPSGRYNLSAVNSVDTVLDWTTALTIDENLKNPLHDRESEYYDQGAETIYGEYAIKRRIPPTKVASLFSSASANWMHMSASVNIFGKTKVKKVTYERGEIIDFEPVNFEDSQASSDFIWTIQPKWETPIFNFINKTGSIPSVRKSENETVGIWHQYGDIPSGNEGVWFELSDIPDIVVDSEGIWKGRPENVYRRNFTNAHLYLYIRESGSLGDSGSLGTERSILDIDGYAFTASNLPNALENIVRTNSSSYGESGFGNLGFAKRIQANVNTYGNKDSFIYDVVNRTSTHVPMTQKNRYRATEITFVGTHPWSNDIGHYSGSTDGEHKVVRMKFEVINAVNYPPILDLYEAKFDEWEEGDAVSRDGLLLKYPDYYKSGKLGNDMRARIITEGNGKPFAQREDSKNGWLLEGTSYPNSDDVINSTEVYFMGGKSPTFRIKSLADLMGFKKTKKRLGTIREEKKIKEAVIAIPFIERQGEKDFFKISRREIELASGERKIRTGEKMPGQTIIRMANVMKDYVLPPKLDFLTNKTIDPIVMYIFEFEDILTKEDLGNIWQNLSPDIGRTFKQKEATISHELLKEEFFSGKIENELRWMVFKVKQKAAKNYFAVTSDSSDDERFKFNFQIGNKDSSKKAIPDYSYNWPYDFFSLVELVKIDSEIKFDKKKND